MSRTLEPILIDGKENAATCIILAHSAGAPMDSPFLNAVASGLSSQACVIRFEFPYMAARRDGIRRPPDREPLLLETWRTMIAAHRGNAKRLVIGGKSMGSRIATMVADECNVDGVVCFGYPFHAKGKEPGKRIEHLRTLRTPTLIVQGTRDEMGSEQEVLGYGLPREISIAWIAGADHSFTKRRSSSAPDPVDIAISAARSFLDSIAEPGASGRSS